MSGVHGMSADGDFIEVIDDALDRATCEAIVARFEASGQDRPGLVGSGHFPDLKKSSDISITGQPDWQDVEQRLNQAVFGGLLRYLRRYPFALIAPLMVQRGQDASSVRRIELHDFETMDDQELANIAMAVFRPGRVNLQRYRAGEGGYPYWHCET